VTIRVAAIVVAAGSGERFGDRAKVLTKIGGRPMLWYSLRTLTSVDVVSQMVVVSGEHTFHEISALVSQSTSGSVIVCRGGSERQDSVRAGLAEVEDGIDLVLVHDGARPFASLDLMNSVIEKAVESGAAVPAIAPGDTLYSVDQDGNAQAVVDRRFIRSVQTPQVARREWLDDALEAPGFFTDEGSALLARGYPVSVVPGRPENLKVTYPADVSVAEAFLARQES
jgi:2-C-methyl-D-erythritol 4-phosphate cytidylyltransferase